MNSSPAPAAQTWLLFTLLTVFSWGVYGILLHKGQTLMQPAGGKLDPTELRMKAFLFVGIAYFLTAVLAPLAILLGRGAAFGGYTGPGMAWSLVAGIAGAVGAFGVLLAFGAKGTPPVVMSIIFAGAPLVNALIATLLHPPAGGWASVKPQFYLGIVLAVAGGFLVARFNPGAPAPKKPAVTQPAAAPAAGAAGARADSTPWRRA
jgi:drug/metabolite transporter (DMT)-like permease